MNDIIFDGAFEKTLGLEGGYVSDPDDPGGETKFGISKRAYPDIDIAALTIDQAKEIYFKDYWQALSLDKICLALISEEIFDTAVNMGRRRATFIAQSALNFLGEDLVEDGFIGIKTITALNKWSIKDARALFICLNGFQFLHYQKIIKFRRKSLKFARGWTKRIQQYQEA